MLSDSDNAVLSAKTTATPRTLIAGFISKAVDGPNAYDLHVRRHNSTVHEDDKLTAGETNMPPGMASSTTDITDFVVPDDVQDSVRDGKIIVEETMAVTNKGQDFVDFQTSHVISIPSPGQHGVPHGAAVPGVPRGLDGRPREEVAERRGAAGAGGEGG